jgi:TolB-like protein/DNA-binding winged helix-turn-helix (wHTH) protein/Tfp pilus assembly protein PilF
MTTQRLPDRVIIRFGEFAVDLFSRELFRNGQKIRLQEQPFHILSVLLENPGVLVTRDELRQRLWPEETFVDFDLGLNKAVAKLRESLGDDATSPKYIETLLKRGYRFVAPVTHHPNSDAPVPSLEAAVKEHSRSWPRQAWFVGMVAFILTAAVVALISMALKRKPAASSPSRSIIAVLPFKNLSPDLAQEYLSDGLTIELITALSRAYPSQLGVIGPTSSMAYRGTAKSLREIAGELNADYIVEGTVRRDGNRVRITAQLTRVDDQTQIWAQVFEQQRQGLFEIQTAVAQAIADAVRVETVPRLLLAPRNPPTANQEAYDEYLKGMYLERMKGDAPGAVQHFERAVKLETNFARAWAGLANAYVYMKPATRFMPQARDAADRAKTLDPNLASAHATSAIIRLMWDWDWPGAQQEFERAIQLEPNDPDVLRQYAQYLASTGKLDQAIVAVRHAQELDPRSPLIGQILGRFYYFDRQPENAIYEWEQTLKLDPDFYWSHLFLSFAYHDQGKHEKWYEHKRRALEISRTPHRRLDLFDRGAKEVGYEKLELMMLKFQEASALAGNTEWLSLSLAIQYAKRGDTERALFWLEKGLEQRPIDAIYLNVEPAYDVLRSDPRFQAVVERVGIPPAK